MSDASHISGSSSPTPRRYFGEAMSTFLFALFLGPALGLVPLVVVDAVASLENLNVLSLLGGIVGEWSRLIFFAYLFGMPIAVLAGAIAAAIVYRNGAISYWSTAVISFFTPIMLLFLLRSLVWISYGVAIGGCAAFSAVLTQYLGLALAGRADEARP